MAKMDRLIEVGLNIAYYRKLRGMTQFELAEKAFICRTHLSKIEAPNLKTAFSMMTLFDLADALEVSPCKLLEFKGLKRGARHTSGSSF